jgi:ribonuclease VapC
VIVIDTSALIAVLQNEPDAETLKSVIENADRRVVSAVSLLETGIVMRARHGQQAIQVLADMLEDAGIEVAPFDHVQASIAISAFDQYGKGLNPLARLNFGDCAAFALAKHLDAPLLFKGEDFAATDIQPAL